MRRALVGRPVHSGRLEHTLLPKVLALPVFASDALSSVAYATGEVLVVLAAVAAAPQGLIMPVAIAIAILMIVVVASYRQTVRAYPGGGGAYTVARENLGRPAALFAAAALLIDYVLTVSVSINAGVFALTSAAPGLSSRAVLISLVLVATMTLLNLRGARESGRLFALPTYGFVVAVAALVGVGFLRCASGCPTVPVTVEPIEGMAPMVGAVGAWALLRAFASGATALTGVEAISDGVPAFRHPQARNAAVTLAAMGAIAVSMFLGVSWLAAHVSGVVPSHERSVVAQIALAVFGEGWAFWVVQVFTALILVLAANTAYQDFPRLASFLARDRYLPVQFRRRGDRLVFSNGIVGLGLCAAAVMLLLGSRLSTMIQLYIIGVFVPFTISQLGMCRYWVQRRVPGEPRWRRGALINGVGATATACVLLVVVITKLAGGAAWLVVAMGLWLTGLVAVLGWVHAHYRDVDQHLARGATTPRTIGARHSVLLVPDLGPATAEAVAYARSVHGGDVVALFPSPDAVVPDGVATAWLESARGLPALRALAVEHDLLSAVRGYLGSLSPAGPNDYVTVIVPEALPRHGAWYPVTGRELIRLKSGLLRHPGIVVTDVPMRADAPGRPSLEPHPWAPAQTVALAFVSGVNDASIRAVNYAEAIATGETRAIFFDIDPGRVHMLHEEWLDSGLGVPLDILEAPYRDLPGHMLEEVRRWTGHGDTLVSLIVPELVVPRRRHLLLHNQSSLFLKGLMLYEDRVVLSSVPFLVPRAHWRGRGGGRNTSHEDTEHLAWTET